MAEHILDLKEISKHKTKDDLWIILYDKVYDITAIVSQHPGGEKIVLKHVAKNQDLTEPFEKVQHSSKARYVVSEFVVGTVPNTELKSDDNGKKQTLFSIVDSDKPTGSELSQNIWDYEPEKPVNAVRKWGDKRVLGWGDLFSVKIEMLDNQHESLLNLLNKMVNVGNINDLDEFLSAWDIHCETEHYLFDVYHFEQHKKKQHMKAHAAVRDKVQREYEALLSKYEDKLKPKDKAEDVNTEPFECAELMSFVEKEMAPSFKNHAFEYDSLYIDKLGDKDPSIYVQWEKSSRFNLMRPIFPDDDKIQLAIFQESVYGNNQLMLQLQQADNVSNNLTGITAYAHKK
eukprot:124135_1